MKSCANAWRSGTARRQQGAALVITLMILLVLSVIGISAMRITMSQNMIASGSLAAEMAFQAAETGISQVITEGEAAGQLTTRDVLPLPGAGAITRCVREAAGQVATQAGACGTGAFSDSRGVSQAQVVISTPDPDNPVVAARNLRAQVQFGAVPGAVIESFVIQSTGQVPALSIRTVNTQETIYPHL
ncbi:MAG: PilX N-terminal domain-containing pilus assembly protein [Moraxellaceae bacterium]